jgi:uncharacterized membrane protein
LLILFHSLIGFANESTVLADSSKKEEKGIDIIVVGGLGIAYGSNLIFSLKQRVGTIILILQQLLVWD